MDCAPTLDVVDGLIEEEEEEAGEDRPKVWGRLFPLGKGFVAQDFVKEEYTFGRGETCDYCFESHGGRMNAHFLALSKTHFRIFRKKHKVDPERYDVFIQDKSSNGTFINGEKLGKNKTRVLNNNDELSLALKKNSAFIFNECEASTEQDRLPEEFRAKYIMSKQLGRGACGEVKLVFEKGTCAKFAVKIINKKAFSVGPKIERAVMDEVKILKSMQHPCIITIEDVIDSPDALYIVLELVEGGELFDRVVDMGKFSEPVAKLLFYQLLVAVKYLHDKGITHRDLKPENVLLATDKAETLIKVTDFGLSRVVGENSLMQTLCGTPSYLAPEILKTAGMGGYGKAVDCWSMGVILYIMLGGYPPFSDEITEYSLHDQICQGHYSFPPEFWKNVSDDAINLIKQLLTLDPKKRLTTVEALEHPWMQDDKVIAQAKKLMEDATGSRSSMSPPPNLGRKRSAPTNDDDDESSSSFTKPTKCPTLDKPTTPDHPPPRSPLNGEEEGGKEAVNGNRQVLRKTSNATTRSLSNESSSS